MVPPGTSRQNLAGALTAAYARGLLSESTLSHRLDLLFGNGVIDSAALVGDLGCPAGQHRWRTRVVDLLATVATAIRGTAEPTGSVHPRLLPLDWSGRQEELILGRHHSCDVVLTLPSVSRRHARLAFRDGTWVIQDLESRNGTQVNGVPVRRFELRPGDHVFLGDEHLVID